VDVSLHDVGYGGTEYTVDEATLPETLDTTLVVDGMVVDVSTLPLPVGPFDVVEFETGKETELVVLP
jgi:hypothetical protein